MNFDLHTPIGICLVGPVEQPYLVDRSTKKKKKFLMPVGKLISKLNLQDSQYKICNVLSIMCMV